MVAAVLRGAGHRVGQVVVPDDAVRGELHRYGQVLAAAGNLLVSDYSGDNVRLYDGLNGDDLGEFVSAGSGGLNGTWDATFGADGYLYVASSVTNNILRYDGTTGEFIDVFAEGGGLSGPIGAVFGPDGNLYVSGSSTAQIMRYDGSSGAFIDIFTSGAGLDVARGLVFGPDGNLYVTHFDNNVARYDGQTGMFIDFFVPTGIGGLDVPADLTFGPDGDLYVSDIAPGANHVLRYDGQTGALIDVFATGLVTPTFLTFVPESDEGEGEGEEVCICHIPPGNPGNAHTICVGQAAVPAHLAHGDDPHPCPESDSSSNAAAGPRQTGHGRR